jgi:ketosteroid isomerase-like protein
VTGDSTTLAAELDAAHARAQHAFSTKDLAAYMAMFAPDLRYTQLNGKTIGRDELARDVTHQLRTVRSAESSFSRASLEPSDSGAVEVVVQNITADVDAFWGLVHRHWQMQRKGRYVWKKTDNVWQIAEVRVLEERIVDSKIRFGLSR